jgi:predicted CopG family antitoxin
MSSPTAPRRLKNVLRNLQIYTFHVFVYARNMKTITLNEAAYERLKAWKTGEDSFSQVVLRMVPKRGTFGDLEDGFRALPKLSAEHFRTINETIASRGEPER